MSLVNLEKIVKDYVSANNKKVTLNSFIENRIRAIQRKINTMSVEEIIQALSLETEFRLHFDKYDWKKLEEIIKRSHR